MSLNISEMIYEYSCILIKIESCTQQILLKSTISVIKYLKQLIHLMFFFCGNVSVTNKLDQNYGCSLELRLSILIVGSYFYNILGRVGYLNQLIDVMPKVRNRVCIKITPI